MTSPTNYDVDLLRPGTVPISPDTVLWFEFLLDPSLLEKHLNKVIPDPSPTDLIVKFLAVAPDVQIQTAPSTPKIGPATPDGAQIQLVSPTTPKAKTDDLLFTEESLTVTRNRKNLALKILSLKVAAYLKWDLNILQSKIPLPLQCTLLKDLLFLAMNEEVDVEKHVDLVASTLSKHALFAVTLYHRWVLRAIISSVLPTKQSRLPFIAIPGLSDSNYSPAGVYEELMRRLEMQVSISVKVLSEIDAALDVSLPVFDCFVLLTEDTREVVQDWDKATEISATEFHCQLNFDLGCYYFYVEDYVNAGRHFLQARQLFSELGGRALVYCTAAGDEIEGYCAACDVGDAKLGLLEQMLRAVNNQYTGIVGILSTDNCVREIPQTYRDMLEMEIQGAVASGRFTVARDLLAQVQSLNAAVRVAAGAQDNTAFVRNLGASPSTLDMVLNALQALLPSAGAVEKSRIKEFLVNLSESATVPGLLSRLTSFPALRDLFTTEEMELCADDCLEMPASLMQTDWPVDAAILHRNAALGAGHLKQRLILSYDPAEIQELLLATHGNAKPLWMINNQWDLPIPVHSVIMGLPKGLLQDFSYILLAKAKELTSKKNFALAERLLSIVERDLGLSTAVPSGLMSKLTLMLRWESLLIRIVQFLSDAPAPGDSQLSRDCKQCLAALQGGGTMIPRTEIVDHCAVCLLNLGEWDHLVSLEMRWKYFGLAASVASACLDVAKPNGKKKIAKDVWDLVLPTFGPSPQTKRSSSATTSVIHRDSPTSFGTPQSRASLNLFLSRLVHETALAVVISLLARLLNVLRDEASLELAVEHINMWPAAVSNANSYYVRAVSESLTQVVAQALNLYPNNVSWLKLMADLNFVTSHHATALKYYLNAGIVSSNFFTQPIPCTVLDNHIYKRMIKCCTALSCHTQAAILCQFLDEVDHMSAFKSLGDAKTSDAMDSYYTCIWDPTILEHLVQLHVKRGEQHSKQQAIKIMGLLELNANNNEEIQREAINIRKARFLRAMARQYVIG